MKALALHRPWGLCSDDLYDPLSQRLRRLPLPFGYSPRLILPVPGPTAGEHCREVPTKEFNQFIEVQVPGLVNVTRAFGPATGTVRSSPLSQHQPHARTKNSGMTSWQAQKKL